MNVSKSITINQPIDLVWKILAEDFDQAHLWMGFVKRSYELDAKPQTSTAPVAGRVCEFKDDPKALYAEEVITEYNKKDHYIVFDVVPKNAPGLLPLKKNVVKATLVDLGDNQTKVLWVSTPELKPMGKILSPLLKMGLGKAFTDILKDLKKYCEGLSYPENKVA